MWKEAEEKSLEIYLRQAKERLSGVSSAEEEKRLVCLAQKGDREALSRLVESLLAYVFQVALQYRGRGVPLVDLVAEGNLGLLQAIQRYDPSQETRLITYARWWIMNRILHALRTQHLIPLRSTDTKIQKTLREILIQHEERGIPPPSLEDLAEHLPFQKELLASNLFPVQFESLDRESRGMEERKIEEILEDVRHPTPENLVIREELYEQLHNALDHLTPRQREVVVLYYGLRGSPPHTLEQIAQIMGISRQGVHNLLRRALKTLSRKLGIRFWRAYHEWEQETP